MNLLRNHTCWLIYGNNFVIITVSQSRFSLRASAGLYEYGFHIYVHHRMYTEDNFLWSQGMLDDFHSKVPYMVLVFALKKLQYFPLSQNFFKDAWNIFDFICVIGSIVDAGLSFLMNKQESTVNIFPF